MFETITSQLELNLDELVQLVEKTDSAHHSPSPFLRVHPPHAREKHTTSTRARSNELTSLLDTIQSLETKIGALRQRVFRQQRRQVFALTAISALPSEMLRRIFTFATGDTPHAGCQVVSASSALSQVCYEWHDVTMTQRALWKDIRLPSPRLGYTDELLKLSKGEFLDVNLYDTRYPPVGAEIIRESQQRFHSLDISSVHAYGAEKTFSRLIPAGTGPFEFSNLESLSLADGDNTCWGYSPRSLTFPNLRRLVLYNASLSPMIHAPRLVTLDIHNRTRSSEFVDSLHDLLAGSPRLEVLKIHNEDNYSPQWLSEKPTVTLEHLKSLKVDVFNFLVLADVLSRFKAPHLEHFSAEDILRTPDYQVDDVEVDDVEVEEFDPLNSSWSQASRFEIRKTVSNSLSLSIFLC